jgi:hypothetical protein
MKNKLLILLLMFSAHLFAEEQFVNPVIPCSRISTGVVVTVFDNKAAFQSEEQLLKMMKDMSWFSRHLASIGYNAHSQEEAYENSLQECLRIVHKHRNKEEFNESNLK